MQGDNGLLFNDFLEDFEAILLQYNIKRGVADAFVSIDERMISDKKKPKRGGFIYQGRI